MTLKKQYEYSEEFQKSLKNILNSNFSDEEKKGMLDRQLATLIGTNRSQNGSQGVDASMFYKGPQTTGALSKDAIYIENLSAIGLGRNVKEPERADYRFLNSMFNRIEVNDVKVNILNKIYEVRENLAFNNQLYEEINSDAVAITGNSKINAKDLDVQYNTNTEYLKKFSSLLGEKAQELGGSEKLTNEIVDEISNEAKFKAFLSEQKFVNDKENISKFYSTNIANNTNIYVNLKETQEQLKFNNQNQDYKESFELANSASRTKIFDSLDEQSKLAVKEASEFSREYGSLEKGIDTLNQIKYNRIPEILKRVNEIESEMTIRAGSDKSKSSQTKVSGINKDLLKTAEKATSNTDARYKKELDSLKKEVKLLAKSLGLNPKRESKENTKETDAEYIKRLINDQNVNTKKIDEAKEGINNSLEGQIGDLNKQKNSIDSGNNKPSDIGSIKINDEKTVNDLLKENNDLVKTRDDLKSELEKSKSEKSFFDKTGIMGNLKRTFQTSNKDNNEQQGEEKIGSEEFNKARSERDKLRTKIKEIDEKLKTNKAKIKEAIEKNKDKIKPKVEKMEDLKRASKQTNNILSSLKPLNTISQDQRNSASLKASLLKMKRNPLIGEVKDGKTIDQERKLLERKNKLEKVGARIVDVATAPFVGVGAGAAAVGIGALTAGKAAGQGVMKVGKAAEELAMKAAKAAGEGIKKGVETLEKGALNAGKTVKETAKTVSRGIKQGAETVGKEVLNAGKTAGQGIKKGVETVGKEVLNAGKTAGQGIKKGVETLGKGALNAGKTVEEAAKATKDAAKKTLGAVENKFNKAGAKVNSYYEAFKQIPSEAKKIHEEKQISSTPQGFVPKTFVEELAKKKNQNTEIRGP